MSLLFGIMPGDVAQAIADFGECLKYEPLGEAPLELMAIIDRHPPSGIPGLGERSGGGPGAQNYKHQITIVNACSVTVGAIVVNGRTKINKGKDFAWISPVIGGKPERLAVLNIAHSDQGLWLLDVG